MPFFIRIACLLLFFLTACETPPPHSEQQAQSKSQQTTQGVFHQPLTPERFELATDALPHWREFAAQKPALVVMSYDPFLAPLPEELRAAVKELVQSGSAAELERRSGFYRAETLLLSTQAVSAAISADLFSEVVWVFPAKQGPETLSLQTFREQMLESGFLTPAEAEQLTLKRATFSGTVRGLPFRAVHHLGFEKPHGPALLHIDLSFFDGLYDNEVSTPLYTLLNQTANRLRQLQWTPQAITLSASTLEGTIALQSRFVIRNLAELIENPRLLEQEIAAAWSLRAQALYAADMFTESKKLDLYRQAAELAPEDPSVRYDLFQAQLQGKQIDAALTSLQQATAGDDGYAASYLAIAELARQDGNLAATLDFLEQAKPFYPLNPFIDLGRAELYLDLGQPQQALQLLDALNQLNWSPHYHAEVPQHLEMLQQAVQQMLTEQEQRP